MTHTADQAVSVVWPVNIGMASGSETPPEALISSAHCSRDFTPTLQTVTSHTDGRYMVSSQFIHPIQFCCQTPMGTVADELPVD